jgi:hypothetical protein
MDVHMLRGTPSFFTGGFGRALGLGLYALLYGVSTYISSLPYFTIYLDTIRKFKTKVIEFLTPLTFITCVSEICDITERK